MTKDLEKKYQNLHKKRRYELLNYDKKRHIELLNKKGAEFDSKLLPYSIILINHLNWEIRDQYLELLENYIEKKINSFNFRIIFSERYQSVEKIEELLESNRILLSPDKNSLDFGNLLSKIDGWCQDYSDDSESSLNKFEISEDEFRISIEEIYLEIQNFLEKE